jgi:hypothetical protein
MLFESAWWRTELPSGWVGELGEDCASLYHPEGVGALQVSAFRKDGGNVSDADLHEFAKDQYGANLDWLPVEEGSLSGIHRAWDDGDSSWCAWFLRGGALLLFVTYNCAFGESRREVGEVREILSRIQVASEGAA